jgi:hypothetical protein
MRLRIEVCQPTLGRTEVSFARIHVLIGVVTNRKHAGLPVEPRAAPEAGGRVVLR